MADKIERVAKALERKYHKEHGGSFVCGGKPDCWKSMKPFAQVAIRALRATKPKASRGKITDTMRLNRVLAEKAISKNFVMEINRYGAGAVGNPIVSFETREDIDAVIRSEAKPGKGRSGA